MGLRSITIVMGFFFLDNTEDCDFNGILIIIIPENFLIEPISINSN